MIILQIMEQEKNRHSALHLRDTIPYTNGAIDELKFTGKLKPRFRKVIHFKSTDGSVTRGLSLRWIPSTNKKTFQLRYKFINKDHTIDLGDYSKTFGTLEVQELLVGLFRKHKDKNGKWITNPKIEIMSQEELQEKDQPTIRRVIELICKKGFSRKNINGFLSSDSLINHTRYLIGYNKRKNHIRYIDDEKGWGKILFKDDSLIKNWDQLFKEYPPGVGVKDPKGHFSLYDSDLGALKIKDLTPGLVENYININNATRGYGAKESILESLSCLWNFARSELLCFGANPPLNPCRKEHGGVRIKRDEENNYRGKQYNNLVFSLDQLEKTVEALKSLRNKYPFIAEALLFLVYTGVRIQEALKVRYDMILNDNDGDLVIRMKRHILKGRGSANQEDEDFLVTPPIQEVLDMVKEQLNKPEHTSYKLLNTFIFLSPRLSIEKLINPVFYPGYKDSQDCRLKETGLVNCWNEVKKITGINGAIKTLRKTYITTSVRVAGLTGSKSVTKHKHTTTTDRHYNKSTAVEAKEYAREVAKVLQFRKVV
jgi:integrase